jgi:hypothetical protein
MAIKFPRKDEKLQELELKDKGSEETLRFNNAQFTIQGLWNTVI